MNALMTRYSRSRWDRSRSPITSTGMTLATLFVSLLLSFSMTTEALAKGFVPWNYRATGPDW